MKILLALTAIVSVAGLGTAASAADVTRSTTVNYADLNVGSAAGMQRLTQRVNNAARDVCNNRDSQELAALNAYNKCRKGAVASAMTAFNAKNAPVLASR
ncbi:MAG: UrcA family protein [Janthinobacterium lividum]